ncbi:MULTISPECIES: hypothetical protein [Pseudomonas]|uniref:hypothetical protein n=1 Tax=Pseudomonas TaxID=286 RepID=UPI00115FE5D6|nr:MULTISPECIES: hypothetical protein [Pseudomonas]QVE17284.1 hypothetical protein KGD89_00470 [Pseudomonas cichorii]
MNPPLGGIHSATYLATGKSAQEVAHLIIDNPVHILMQTFYFNSYRRLRKKLHSREQLFAPFIPAGFLPYRE